MGQGEAHLQTPFRTGSGRTGIMQLPVIFDVRGSLTSIEGGRHIPFDIARVYYLYGVPEGKGRGGHAHRELQQLLIAVSGSITVVTDNGTSKETHVMNRPDQGLYIGPWIWRDLTQFSADAACIVLASQVYDESDYIRDYNQYQNEVSV
ncbi:sugar 3,4-ketoisomerase [Methylorubrum extorquens]|uniref:sugar 3,4-ketoisomerase n=1 Tax=Methylorubrum extorquens TaxID=408 RepID=UPI001EE59D38|nr:FdtA/QdtA family cupin domain-containing protein [Methylorubrum extorquens]MCG5247837.1 FdtA/QdtA family cupin domain-containing protein [Methylorubrum extorquens]